MIKRRPFNQLAVADYGWLDPGHRSSARDRWEAGRMGDVMMTYLAIALRGLLVTTTAVATIAYLLLTNSHI
jgi:hypothetical protein